MAVKQVVTGGYGNGTFTTTIALVTLRGFVSGEEVVVVDGEVAEARQSTLAGISKQRTLVGEASEI